ncbi:murein hydrolase activator EnvC family protein [Mycoplasma sp. P36-A1]|uniref:murein hydrolase activator EnvC family protein n=1 Tax=Mycoplasma sp. P36-A1 TaxID=3252900 RepID=UPI003C2F819C
MKFVKAVLALGLFTASISLINVNAEIDFSANEAHYQKLCAKRSSFNANKKTCTAFESYLKQQKSDSEASAKSIQGEISSIKGDISKLLEAINKNAALIETKKKDVTRTNEEIKIAEENIKKLEAEIKSRIALMQEINGENFVIDFLMSSASLDDLFTKMDGINAINFSNTESIKDLSALKSSLAEKKVQLEKEQKELVEYEKTQNEMLTEYRKKEKDLFVKLEDEHKKKSVYNSKLNNLNINDLVAQVGKSGTLQIPVSHAVVTATAWYYPASFGGGWHPGIDLAANTGTPIKAPANGVVLLTGNGLGYGNYMVTAHQIGNDTYTFVYGHMSRYANFGSSIKQGQTVAYVGSTGNSTGPHLHMEIFKHTGKSLKNVINTYRANGDLYFGLGYASVGSCSNVCRLKPHSVFGLKYGQSY